MDARDTRAGGRHLAAERGAFDLDPGHFGAEFEYSRAAPGTAPLFQFLNDRSRAEVLNLLARIERRRAA
jgi:hypothetical protein